MAGLIGICFSTPEIVLLVIDTRKYHLHLFDGQQQDLIDFLDTHDPRKKVVMTTELSRIMKATALDKNRKINIHILFEKPNIIKSLDNAVIVDAVENEGGTWEILQIDRDYLDSLLSEYADKEFSIPENIKEILKKEDVPLLREHIQAVVDSLREQNVEVKQLTCEFVVGAMTAKMWKNKVKKDCLEAGGDVDRIIELERFASHSTMTKALFRAYHLHRKKKLAPEEAAAKTGANLEDLEMLIHRVPPENNIKFVKDSK